METDSSSRVDLQYCASWPRNLAFMKGSPPAKLTLRMPASLRRSMARLAFSRGSTCDVFAVWKQKPRDTEDRLVSRFDWDAELSNA